MNSWVLDVILALAFLSGAVAGPAQEIGYLEKFSLAQDRAVALGDLIPGTEEYYYYHCLHYQNSRQLAKVDELLPLWIKRYNYTPLVEEIRNRQALLSYALDPKKSLAFLALRLGLRFDHQREIAGEKPTYPTDLDPKDISHETLYQRAMARFANLDGFEPSALEAVAQGELDALRLHDLLSRLERPDLPNLPALVAKDLASPEGGGFGSLPIHKMMLRDQLDELVRLRPELRDNEEFVKANLERIQPGPDVEWQRDPEEHLSYCNRLWEYVGGLAPAFNSLKASVLYERLLLDRRKGQYDKARFLEYVRLPRPAAYMNPEYLEAAENHRYPADLSADFSSWTDLLPIEDDEALVRDYLLHFLVSEDSTKPYAEYIRDTILKQLLAESKLVNGLGDAESWYSLLPPDGVQALQSRVDLDFAFTNHEVFAADESPRLDLFIKNVKNLIVRVFEINTLNYYRDLQQPVDININLDGLVPSSERVERYDEIPLRRVLRSFEFPQLKKRGVYIVEFIGNGKSSRALIRKGELRLLEKISTAGHVFRVLDEMNRKVEKAEIYLAGHNYQADSEGKIVLPFTREPGRRALVVRQGDFAWLDHFNHKTESYSLAAGFFVDRESLLKRNRAQVLVRPSLQIHGMPVTLSVLEDVRLSITSVDRDGVSTRQEIADFRLFEDRESTHEFLVQENLSALTFTLKARVKSLSEDKKVDLESSATFRLNEIDRVAKTETLLLLDTNEKWFLDLLGKTGEAKPGRPLEIDLKHRDFREPVHKILQTDAAGRIQLGALADIQWIKARGPEGTTQTWSLPRDFHNYQATIHAQANELIRVPYMGRPGAPVRSQVSLLESRSGIFVRDCIEAVQIWNGFLEISNLTAGDYDLLLKETGHRITLRLSGGEASEGWEFSSHRQLEVRNPRQLQITDVEVGNNAISIRLANTTPFTRVHIVSTRFLPSYGMAKSLQIPPAEEPGIKLLRKPQSEFEADRKMGSEERYILERRYATKFPGNMLRKPELLLNPWASQTANTEPAEAPSGMSAKTGGGIGGGTGTGVGGSLAGDLLPDVFSNLDFLSESSVVLANLRPDGEVLRVDRKALGLHQQIHILAVDPENTVYRSISLPELQPAYRDLRLSQALDLSKHFAELDKVSILHKDNPFTLGGMSSMESYDSIRSVYRLYANISNEEKLDKFGFILDWPKLALKDKRRFYSEFACHELNFWLFHKDRAFFDQVVTPYLTNKKNKTFLDHWLLEDDLSTYLKPWEFAQLNIVEQILLGQRVASEGVRIERHVRDRYDLLPPNIERLQHYFSISLSGKALESVPNPVLKSQAGGLGVGGDGVPAPADTAAEAPGQRAKTLSTLPVPVANDQARIPTGAAPAQAAGESDSGASFWERDNARRETMGALYRSLGKTEEYAETNYYQLPIERMNGDLIEANAFWMDYARHNGNGPFLSINLAEASRNFPEMMLALSVLDLPIESGKHETTADGARITLKPGYPIIVFHKEIREVQPAAEKLPVQVLQNYFRPDDRYRYEGSERIDKYVTEGFLRSVIYGCQVILTNPTPSAQKLGVLLQIPEGAIPVQNGFVTRSRRVRLEPHSTQTFEYSFYFPMAGKFRHYPAQISKDEWVVASAPAAALEVADSSARIDGTSWEDLSQQGTSDAVIEYLQRNNLDRLALDKIAWRMRDRGFFVNVIDLLRARHVYNHTLWSYALYHDDRQSIQEYLQHSESFLKECGEYIDAPLITVDPVVRKTYQHLEYAPLVNARIHQPGQVRRILNTQFHQQYMRFLKVLSYHPQLEDEDWIEIAGYLLLQDRIDEALAAFSKVRRDRLSTKIQYDYMQAYLAFSQGQPSIARQLALRYSDYPVDRWRRFFTEVLDQCDEIDGRVSVAARTEGQTQIQSSLAGAEPALDLKIESKKIRLVGQNVKECALNFYKMDTELLFSRNPFARDFAGQFSYARQNRTMIVRPPQDRKPLIVELPTDLQNEDLIVEAVAGGVRSTVEYTANRLVAQMMENYGQVQVAEEGTGKRLPNVYVKVYARMAGGKTVFYKDGYTDLRGRFDYASLNTDQIGRIERFALLMISETHGSVIREVSPPKR